LTFPPDSPQDLLNIKGKIFRGELKKSNSRITITNLSYLILLGYNSYTKELTVYLVLEKGYGSGYEVKPAQGMLKGTFDLENGSALRWVQSNDIKTQEYQLRFLKNGNLSTNRSDGYIADYSPVALLPEER
jgi:hypothetical protein